MHLSLISLASNLLAVSAPLHTLATSTPSPGPSPSPSPTPDYLLVVQQMRLSIIVWITALSALVIGSIAYFISRQKQAPVPVDDKALEAARISYGFWLIVAGLFLTLAVVTLALNVFRPQPSSITSADILAVITAVTGIVGTVTAAFFGVQAAGAGRSQALTALENIQTSAKAVGTNYKLAPPSGPHAGNTRVSVSGNGFTGANAVNFGMTTGQNFDFVNDGLVRATTPPSSQTAKSDVDVVVCFPTASVQNVKAGTFYYYTVTPAQGSVAGGTQVTIIGTGLTGAVSVSFGTTAVPNPTTNAAGNLVVNSPPGALGTVDVTVTFPVAASKNFVVGQFEYVAGAGPDGPGPGAGGAGAGGAGDGAGDSGVGGE